MSYLMSDDTFIAWAVKNNPQATYVCKTLMWIAQVWDDLIDKDKPVSDEDINKVFRYMLLDLPRTPFYIENIESLTAVLNIGISDFLSANALEKKTDMSSRRASFILRNNYSSIITHCAFVVGGREWMDTVATSLVTRIHDEDFDEYLRSIA